MREAWQPDLWVFIQDVPGYADVYVAKASQGWGILQKNKSSRSGNQFSWNKPMLEPGDSFKFVIIGERFTVDDAWRIYTLPCNRWGRMPKSWFGWDGEKLWVLDPRHPIHHIGEWNEHNVMPLAPWE